MNFVNKDSPIHGNCLIISEKEGRVKGYPMAKKSRINGNFGSTPYG